jgi:hypothetical protein
VNEHVNRRAAEQTAADAADALRERIEPTLAADSTWAAWCKRNRPTLVLMTRAGMSCAEILAAHARESEFSGGTIRSMKFLQLRIESRHLLRQHSAPNPPRARPVSLN